MILYVLLNDHNRICSPPSPLFGTNAIVGRIAMRQKCSPQHVLHDFTRRVHERLQAMAANSTDEAHT